MNTLWTFVSISGGVGVGRADTGKTVGRLVAAGASLHSTPFVKTLASPGTAGHLTQPWSAAPPVTCSTAALQQGQRPGEIRQFISTLLQSVVTLSPDGP